MKNGFVKYYRINANDIQILSFDDTMLASDDILEDASLEIKVYA